MPEKSLPLVNDASPEARLWAEVLYRAIQDLDDAEERPGALAWFRSRSEAPGSLHFVCHVLQHEPGYIRQMVKDRKRPAPPPALVDAA